MNLLLITISLLTFAVVIGTYLVFVGLRHRKRLPALGLTHAGLAFCGIVLLFTLIFTSPSDKLNNVAALFMLFALVGGGMVFALREQDRPPSIAMVIAHAIMGLAGLSLLILNV